MKRILTGLKPTGDLTLGNYIGSIKQMVKLQNEYDSYIFVADLHALTIAQDPKELNERIRRFIAMYIACGIDPNKNTIYLQSENEFIPAMSYLLECSTTYGEASRMIQFKEKSKQNANFSVGLLTYPVLMAADILLYNANEVPVGYDQLQHIEIARDIAERVNGIYGDIFTVPKGVLTKVGAKVMSLQDPLAKMSKSDPNPKAYISVLDDDATIMKKFKAAVTDSETEIRFDPENKPGVSNLLTIMAVAQKKSVEEVVKDFDGLMYGHLKVRTGEAVCEMLRPMKEEYNRLINDEAYLMQCAREGAQRAQVIAEETLNRFKNAIGYVMI